jgi:hypothetical protein
MTITFPITELMDRLAIAEVKSIKSNGANKEELAWYAGQAASIDTSVIINEYTELKQIHVKIWELEALLKSGHEEQLPLEEIGRRAIEIRNYNNQRVKLKNTMAEKLNCPVREIKKDHISE